MTTNPQAVTMRGETFADIDLPAMGRSASGRRWVLRDADMRESLTIAQNNALDPVLARVLAARGVRHDSVDAYLNPSLRNEMPDPCIMQDMERAAARIAQAVLDGEQAGVFGDYDVDGTTAAAILKRYFDMIGAPLSVYLPDRITEGYGPSIEAFRSLKSEGASLIITVDCGATAHAPVEAAAAEGIDIVVIDHHMMNGPPPAGAVAVVNPNRPDDISGLNNLSAAGVAFMAVVALNRKLREAGWFKDRKEPDIRHLLDLTALGLVCDVMPLTGLTRVLVSQGLKVLGGGANPGLTALGERAGVKGPPSTYHLGFLLGPRINAAGRIGHARLAFELLTTADSAKCRELAERLHVMNAHRQEIEAAVQEDAVRIIARDNLDKDDVIVVAGGGWHPGVIGIVAGRIKEIYDTPTIVISIDSDLGKGSGRSITGVDLGGAVSALKNDDVLVSGGGHAMAAGLTVPVGNIDTVRQRVNAALGEAVAKARQNRIRQIDGVIAPGAVSKTFAEMIELAGPYGQGNPEPVFTIANLRADYVKTVGKNHLSVTLLSEGGEAVRAIAFRAEGEPLGEMLKLGVRLHVAGKVRADDWRGGDNGQLQITDVALAE
ncbi:MAG: single-stranded-DNA-specific exonuclease RecJ [Pseudomonadota bacterium]